MFKNFSLNVDLSNDAFGQSRAEQRSELIKQLKEVIKKIKDGREDGAIMDSNGNSVGRFEFEYQLK